MVWRRFDRLKFNGSSRSGGKFKSSDRFSWFIHCSVVLIENKYSFKLIDLFYNMFFSPSPWICNLMVYNLIQILNQTNPILTFEKPESDLNGFFTKTMDAENYKRFKPWYGSDKKYSNRFDDIYMTHIYMYLLLLLRPSVLLKKTFSPSISFLLDKPKQHVTFAVNKFFSLFLRWCDNWVIKVLVFCTTCMLIFA